MVNICSENGTTLFIDTEKTVFIFVQHFMGKTKWGSSVYSVEVQLKKIYLNLHSSNRLKNVFQTGYIGKIWYMIDKPYGIDFSEYFFLSLHLLRWIIKVKLFDADLFSRVILLGSLHLLIII